MVYEVDHEELCNLIECYYNAKLPLMVYGTFGIGKSQSVKKKAYDIGERIKGKEVVEWNRLNLEQKMKVFQNPKQYFVLLDIRLSEFDASDIKGLPELQAIEKFKEWLVWRVPFFVKLLENPEGDGILFFDEINLAPLLIQSSCYKIIHDRIVNESVVGSDWLIMGAGNTDEDRSNVFDMAPPLRDRMGEVKLRTPTAQRWIDEFALEKEISPMIIGFLSFKTGSLYKVDFNDKQKFTTPRGWERINNLMINNPEEKGYKKLESMAKSAIGEGIGQEFVSFCKINEQIKLPEIIANPKKLKDIKEINVKWFINTAVAEQYKDTKVKFEKVIEFSRVMDENGDVELVAYLWKLCSSLNKNFKKDFVNKLKQDDELIVKYSKYLA
jgi:hypothetical protein